MKMNTPNKLTLLRMVLVPVFMAAALLWDKYIALAIFIIASFTDFLDGYLARRDNLVTNFGKFMDPLADKLLVTAAMAIFVEWGQLQSWVLMVVLAREFAISGLRMIAASKGVVIAAAWSGKIKTLCTMVGVCVMMTDLTFIALGPVTVNDVCAWLILITTVVSGMEYLVKNWTVLKDEN